MVLVSIYRTLDTSRAGLVQMQHKTLNTIGKFSSSVEDLYRNKFGKELDREAIDWVDKQGESLFQLFDQLINSLTTSFTIAAVLTSLYFVYCTMDLFATIRNQVMQVRLRVRSGGQIGVSTNPGLRLCRDGH